VFDASSPPPYENQTTADANCLEVGSEDVSGNGDEPEIVGGFDRGSASSSEDEEMFDAVDGAELMKCQSNRVTGKDCPGTKAPKSEFCIKHTCGKTGCNKLKMKKSEVCKDCNTVVLELTSA
jgi:hypothetical protein